MSTHHLHLLHVRSGHMSMSALKRLYQAGAVSDLPRVDFGPSESVSTSPEFVCAPCALGKAHRKAFATERNPIEAPKAPLEYCSVDLCGPIILPKRETGATVVRIEAL